MLAHGGCILPGVGGISRFEAGLIDGTLRFESDALTCRQQLGPPPTVSKSAELAWMDLETECCHADCERLEHKSKHKTDLRLQLASAACSLAMLLSRSP